MTTRLDRNPEEIKSQKNLDIAVIGCGGGGALFTIFMALTGTVENFYLYDHDILENHNRNRLPYPETWVNRPKVECLRDFVVGILGNEISIVPTVERFTEATFIPDCHYIIDATDNTISHKLIRKQCRLLYRARIEDSWLNHPTLYRIGAEESQFDCRKIDLSVDYDDDWDNEEISGYEVVPSSACSALAPALCLMIRILYNVEADITNTSLKRFVESIEIVNSLNKIKIIDKRSKSPIRGE